MEKESKENSGQRWLAAYVRIHHEKKVHDRLKEMGITTFLPIQSVVRQWSDRKKKVDRVLIPMMIFVRVDHTEQLEVLQLPAVVRYVVLRGEHTPAAIPDAQMEAFRFMVDLSESPVNFEACDLQPGEKVQVVRGPLKGLTGDLVTVDGKSSIVIRIERLGCAAVEMNASMVERIG